MNPRRLTAPMAALCVLFGATQAIGENLCHPTLAFKEVRLSYFASHRTWSGTLAVDASQCAKTSGSFALSLVRLTTYGPDLRFVERATWQPGQVNIDVELAADEMISDYGIYDVAPCICRSQAQEARGRSH